MLPLVAGYEDSAAEALRTETSERSTDRARTDRALGPLAGKHPLAASGLCRILTT